MLICNNCKKTSIDAGKPCLPPDEFHTYTHTFISVCKICKAIEKDCNCKITLNIPRNMASRLSHGISLLNAGHSHWPAEEKTLQKQLKDVQF